jgi:drug/metabolite transporter (DMT)-like permease
LEDKIIYIIITIINCFFGAVAALILKKTGSKIEKLKPIFEGIKSIWKSGILLGIFIYGLTAILSIWILRKLDVTLFFPLTSITYIFSFILAKKYLNEKITTSKIIGISLIIIGVILLV